MIISFTDYVPAPRYDGLPWTQIVVEESAGETGPWVQIDSFAINPLDADPENPAARDFTTDNATISEGWYRVSFKDAASNTLLTDPIRNSVRLDSEYLPTLAQVALINMGRTRDEFGVELGTFTTDTTPNRLGVLGLIGQAGDDVRDRVGGVIPTDLRSKAQRVIALRTAMLIELSYYSSEVATDRSPYRALKELYDELLPDLVAAVVSEESGESVDDAVTGAGKLAEFGFDNESTWMTRKM